MISKNITIKKELFNPEFVVAIAKKCSSFDSIITLYARDQTVNLKSIVNIFGSSLESDEEAELVFSGIDEEAACSQILPLFQI